MNKMVTCDLVILHVRAGNYCDSFHLTVTGTELKLSSCVFKITAGSERALGFISHARTRARGRTWSEVPWELWLPDIHS